MEDAFVPFKACFFAFDCRATNDKFTIDYREANDFHDASYYASEVGKSG